MLGKLPSLSTQRTCSFASASLRSEGGKRNANAPTRDRRARVAPRAFLEAPLIAASNQWGMWTALAVAGWAGLYSEKFRLGKELSGALVSTLVGLVLSNVGIISTAAPQYDTVNKFLLPLAVPLLLFSADLRRVLRDTGRLLIAFCVGTLTNAIPWAFF